MQYRDKFRSRLNKLKSENRYRTYAELERHVGRHPFATWKSPNGPQDVVIWCSNDYLNMSHNPSVINRMIEVIKDVGTGSGGTRNISGTTPYHEQLEKKLADYHERDAALIFTSAYVVNQTTLATLCKRIPNIEVFSDQLNHASLIEGIKNSKASCSIFKHNNLEHLESLLASHDINQPKIIVFESLYSMDFGYNSYNFFTTSFLASL